MFSRLLQKSKPQETKPLFKASDRSHTACTHIPLAKSSHMAELSIKDWGRMQATYHSGTHILSIFSTTMDEGNVDEEILLGFFFQKNI